MITVKFTFFHDVLCPFCYITSKRLMKVVKEYGKEVTVVHKAFMIISSLDDLKAAAPDEESAVNLFRGEFSILKTTSRITILTRYYRKVKLSGFGPFLHSWHARQLNTKVETKFIGSTLTSFKTNSSWRERM